MAKSSTGTTSVSSTESVEYFASSGFASFLAEHGLSLILSTYQAGQLVTLGTVAGELLVECEGFDRPMGIAYGEGRLAVATRKQLWILPENRAVATELDPRNHYQTAFLARQSHWTGDVQAHEVGWASDGALLFVNTAFSCLCSTHKDFSFVPRWRPPFISALAAEDRCHLNGFALADGEPLYATSLASTDTPEGWRQNKSNSGLILSVPDGEAILSGLCMPHSPRVHGGEAWLLNSGLGQLLNLKVEGCTAEVVAVFPGYARGLAFWETFAFVGLSRIRETAVFGDIPLAKHRDDLRCGVAVVHLPTGRTVATFQFLSGIEEVFEVAVIPGARAVAIAGPYADEGRPAIWLAPSEDS